MTDSSRANPGKTGDTNAKRILKYRIVLANILKYAIPKYNSYSIDDIMEMIPKSKKTPDGFFVDEENTEDLEDSKHIAFDLLFPIKNTVADKVDIWCDIEPQGEYMEKSDNNKQSYDLAVRGVYYLSRMISRQLTSGGKISDYNDLRKCYSIWICFDHIDDRKWKPTVTRYTFSPARILDEDNDPPEKEKNAADLLELIIVRAGGNTDEKSLIGLVNALWRDAKSIPEYIPEEYEGLNSIRKEIGDMCDMKVVWENHARKEGRAEGRVEGIAIGEIKKSISVVQNLLNLNFSFNDALKTAGIDEKTYNEYKNVFSDNKQ